MSEHPIIPEGARRWSIVGPDSGGAYVLQYHEGRVYHVYGGDVAPGFPGVVEESVGAFLMRGGDPAGAGDTDRAADEIRSLLDGWYPMAYADRIRYLRGEPVAVDTAVACADPGLGGHRCSRACAPVGPNERESILEQAERFAGCKLVFGAWECVDDEGSVYTSRDRADVRRA